jgi:hypothetical protein
MRTRLAIACGLIVGLAAAAPAFAQNDGSFSSSQSDGNQTSGGGSASEGESSFSQSSGDSNAETNQTNQNSGGSSSASMVGDTDTTVDQNTSVESGNASSGSQIKRVGGDTGSGSLTAPDEPSVTEGESEQTTSDVPAGDDGAFGGSQGQGKVPESLGDAFTNPDFVTTAETTEHAPPAPDTVSWIMIALMVVGFGFLFRKLPSSSGN